MFPTPEIYLQANIRYHKEQIQAQFGGGTSRRRGTPMRRRRFSGSLSRLSAVALHAR
jgi:hypothetical protein